MAWNSSVSGSSPLRRMEPIGEERKRKRKRVREKEEDGMRGRKKDGRRREKEHRTERRERERGREGGKEGVRERGKRERESRRGVDNKEQRAENKEEDKPVKILLGRVPGLIRLERTFKREVFPAPEGPMMASISPYFIINESRRES